MNIGGFQKNSLIDFPGTVSCIVFTQGCNFICPYCHNPDLVPGLQKRAGLLFDEKEIFSFLKSRQGLVDGVVITGGEPCLQSDLVFFCKKVKDFGYKIKLDTNGSFPKILELLLQENLLDFVSMDIKTSLENYGLVVSEKFDVKKIQSSISLVMNQAPDYEFRTTCSRPFISEAILEDIGKTIKKAKRYVLAKCSRNVKVLDSGFVKSDNHFFSDSEMEKLKMVIEPYASSVIMR